MKWDQKYESKDVRHEDEILCLIKRKYHKTNIKEIELKQDDQFPEIFRNYDIMDQIFSIIIPQLMAEWIRIPFPANIQNIEEHPLMCANLSVPLYCRDAFAQRISWSLLTGSSVKQVVNFFKNEHRVLSIGSGLGFWEYIFELYSPNQTRYICTDVNGELENTFHEIKKLSSLEASKKYWDVRSVFICYPVQKDNHTFNFLVRHQPHKIALVSCGEGGWCGTDEMFQFLKDNYIRENIIYFDNFGNPTQNYIKIGQSDIRCVDQLELLVLKKEADKKEAKRKKKQQRIKKL